MHFLLGSVHYEALAVHSTCAKFLLVSFLSKGSRLDLITVGKRLTRDAREIVCVCVTGRLSGRYSCDGL